MTDHEDRMSLPTSIARAIDALPVHSHLQHAVAASIDRDRTEIVRVAIMRAGDVCWHQGERHLALEIWKLDIPKILTDAVKRWESNAMNGDSDGM